MTCAYEIISCSRHYKNVYIVPPKQPEKVCTVHCNTRFIYQRLKKIGKNTRETDRSLYEVSFSRQSIRLWIITSKHVFFSDTYEMASCRYFTRRRTQDLLNNKQRKVLEVEMWQTTWYQSSVDISK